MQDEPVPMDVEGEGEDEGGGGGGGEGEKRAVVAPPVQTVNYELLERVNFPTFSILMANELAKEHENIPIEGRVRGGLLLLNALDGNNSSTKWKGNNRIANSTIKNLLLQTLNSRHPEVTHICAHVIGKIAKIELPEKLWPNLLGHLISNLSLLSEKPAGLEEATFETLGCIFKEVSHHHLTQGEVKAFLTAALRHMTVTHHFPHVPRAAAKALCNALDFARTSFENKEERDRIMDVLKTAAEAHDTDIREAAFECLASVASTYYGFLEPYMDELVKLTSEAVQRGNKAVAFQGIEFWSSLCDEEIKLKKHQAGDSAHHCHHFILKYLSDLIPMLFGTLIKQHEDQEKADTIWTISMAGGTCLGLVVRNVGSTIVPQVMPYVSGNLTFTKTEWRAQAAAIFALGSIFEFLSDEEKKKYHDEGNVYKIAKFSMRHPNDHVKDTAAWTLRRIFEFTDSRVSSTHFLRFLPAFLDSVEHTSSVYVLEKAYGVIYYLAQVLAHAIEDAEEFEKFSEQLENIFESMIRRAWLSEDDENLRTTAYETLCEVVVRCSDAFADVLFNQFKWLCECTELQSSYNRDKHGQLLALFCVLIQKLCSSNNETQEKVAPHAKKITECLHPKANNCPNSIVFKEAMLAIGALLYACGAAFDGYMKDLCKYLRVGLSSFEEHCICALSVGILVAIFQALGEKVLPYFDDWLMDILLEGLVSNVLHISVKPALISCIGDIALAVGAAFKKLLPQAIVMLQSVCDACSLLDDNDGELEYRTSLMCSIFEAYSGLLQGFKNCNSDEMTHYVPYLLQFMDVVFEHLKTDANVLKAGVAMLGDVADTVGPGIKLLLLEVERREKYQALLENCIKSEDEGLKKIATWADGRFHEVFAWCGNKCRRLV